MVENGDQCRVIGGTHKGKAGMVQEMKTSKTGQVTLTVLQPAGERFKTLGKIVKLT